MNLSAVLGGVMLGAALGSGAGCTQSVHHSEKNDHVIPLHNGPNRFELTGTGQPAMAFVAYRDNFNAHGYSVVGFYARGRGPKDTDGPWLLVPFVGGPDGPQWPGGVFTTSDGADCMLRDLRVYRGTKDDPIEVLVATREFGMSYMDTAAVRFDVYYLQVNSDGEVGVPLYSIVWDHSFPAKHQYCDVNAAFAQELQLGTVGLRSD